MRFLVLREVVEGEMEKRVEERSSGCRGRSRRKEGNEIGKSDRLKRLASNEEGSVRRC